MCPKLLPPHRTLQRDTRWFAQRVRSIRSLAMPKWDAIDTDVWKGNENVKNRAPEVVAKNVCVNISFSVFRCPVPAQPSFWYISSPLHSLPKATKETAHDGEDTPALERGVLASDSGRQVDVLTCPLRRVNYFLFVFPPTSLNARKGSRQL